MITKVSIDLPTRGIFPEVVVREMTEVHLGLFPSVLHSPVSNFIVIKAFVGNLSSSTTEDDLANVFNGLSIVSIRIPRSSDKPSSFGYVEFATLQDLKNAMDVNGEMLNNRSMRLDCAEPRIY